jgi:uncharacterized protein YkwD
MSRRVLPIAALLLAPIACEPRTRAGRSPTPEPEPTTSTPSSPPVATTTTSPSTPTASPPATPSTPPPTFDPAIVLGPAWTPTGLVLPPGWSPNPSGVPWAIPTTFPTGVPGALPFPTTFPTGLPTSMPTAVPTSAPTSAPTTAPTAAPTTAPPSTDAWPASYAAMEDAVIVEVNKRRAAGASCGGKSYAPASPLTSNPMLRTSARRHSQDMATRGFFDHQNPDGQGPSDRMRAAGYLGAGYSGENIAAGRDTASGTVQQWMDSPGHCSNIMNPAFQLIGVGYAYGASAKYKHYWTQNFAGN